MSDRILIVDDDSIVAESLGLYLKGHGYICSTATGGQQALEMIDTAATSAQPFAVLLTDIAMPGMDGLELIRRLRKLEAEIVPIAVTGYGTIESAVETVRLGAIDYLIKPIVDDELRIAVEKAVSRQTLLSANRNLRQQLNQRYGLDNIIGSDQRMIKIYDLIESVAPTKTTVLMAGESGTGKSLIAHAIHANSPRADKPFVQMSCGSIPDTLLESELFGHVKGSFTGAHADKTGKFLAAHTGTIFLDEINSASAGMQLKLLRVLQERRFEPVGSNETVEVDTRIILASNQPLEDLVARGEFRQDLYYRINVVLIQLPPLRDRPSDVPMLAEHFLAKQAEQANRQISGFSEDALAALRAYAWPGNVRELENVIERAVVLTRSQTIHLHDLPPSVLDNSTRQLLPDHLQDESEQWRPEHWTPMPLAEALREPERQIILAALEANDWNRQQTAEKLRINRTTLYKKIKQLGIEPCAETG